jgi:hypothetical protein
MRKARLRAGLVLAPAVLAAGLLGGCVNVDSRGWQDVARGYKETYAPSSPEKDRAIQAAREAAIENGLTARELDDYEIDANRKGETWWVDFHHEKRKGKAWPDRFVVRVAEKGRTEVFRVMDFELRISDCGF